MLSISVRKLVGRNHILFLRLVKEATHPSDPSPPPQKKRTAIKGTLGLYKTLAKIVSPLNPLKFSGSATAVIFEGSCSSFDELKKDGVVIQHIEF